MRSNLKNFLLIFCIFVSACVETDIYLPAFPDMMRAFGVTEGAIQGLLTWNFIGICLSSPIYGPLADAWGRKKPLIGALSLFLAGSLLTIWASNIQVMLVGRVLQGIGSGGCFTLGTAILFDVFQKDQVMNALNRLNLTIPLIMALAPLLGGWLNQAYGFRSNFMAIAALVFISWLACILFFEETLPVEKREPFKLDKAKGDFKRALTSLPLWQIILVCSLTFAAYISFLSGSSVLFIEEFGMDKGLFPIIQVMILGGWVAGSLSLKRSKARWGTSQVKKIGVISAVVGSAWLGIVTLLSPRDPYLLTGGIVIYAFGSNWIFGLYSPEGMEIFPDIKGTVASLRTTLRLCLSAMIIGLTSFCYNATVYPMTLVVVGSVIFIIPLVRWYEKNRARYPEENTDPDTLSVH